jgi:hypothetical protein
VQPTTASITSARKARTRTWDGPTPLMLPPAGAVG